jgi:TDG/mug DNA glycosylase family protein
VPSRKPTPADLAAAHGKRTVPDILAPNLDVIFIGINPGLYSGATGYHFARPGNRFWPALHQSGFTPRQLAPAEELELLKYRIGMTKLVQRATATAAELTDTELRRGGTRIRREIRKLRPLAACFLGVGAYCQAYNLKKAAIGVQPERFEGVPLWVLPNPSGLNANYQLPDFVRLFRELRRSLE